jgi:hypothetical protein
LNDLSFQAYLTFQFLAVDFFNEIRLIWDIIVEIGAGNYASGKGFPQGFEYRWAETKSATPKSCSGPEYIEYVLDWAEKEMNNEAIFPTSSCTKFFPFLFFVFFNFSSLLSSFSFPSEFPTKRQSHFHPIFPDLCHHLFPSFYEVRTSWCRLSFKHIFQARRFVYLGIRFGGASGVGCTQRYCERNPSSLWD